MFHKKLLFILLSLLAIVNNSINANDIDENKITSENDDNDNLISSLENMTNEDLEMICKSRGFEIVRETDVDGTGSDNAEGKLKELSRQDYIDAAKQCLEVEAEMEKVLNDHPDLLAEIEAEAERMRQEQKHLEEQIADAQSKLEEEKRKAGEKFTNAFMENEQHTQQTEDETDVDGEDDSAKTTTEMSGDSNDEEVIDLDNCCDSSKTETDEVAIEDASEIDRTEDAENTNEDTTTIHSEKNNSSDTEDLTQSYNKISGGKVEDREEINLEGEAEEETSSSISDNGIGKQEILSIGGIIKEIREQISKDLTRVFDVILPAPYRGHLMDFLRPILSVVKDTAVVVKDMLKRYSSIIMTDLRSKTNNETSYAVSEKVEANDAP